MIGVFKKKDYLPEYLSHYGMHRAPFSSEIEDDMFYSDPIREQRLNVLFHLTQNTNELLVLIGEEGIGKTTFVDQFRRNAAEHWRLCFIDGDKTMSEEHFLQLVCKGFKIDQTSTHKGTMLSNLRKRLETMLEEAIPVILVIDNAHLFSTKVLALVIEIASIKNTKTAGSVRVILAAEPHIKILLAEPELDDTHDLIIRKIDLPPLDESHTGDYLHHRLTQAGMKVEQFLTKSTIHKIYKKSGGVPKKINEAADKLLFDTTPIIRRTSHVKSTQQSSGRRKIIFLILLLVIISIALLLYFGLPDKYVETSVDEHTGKTTTTLKLPPVNKTNVTNELIYSGNVGDEPADPMQSLKEELADSIPATTTENETSNAENPDIEKSQTQPGTETNTPPPEKSSTPQLKDNLWVLAQKETEYTLQLVAGHQKQTITNFIEKYQLGNDLIYFSSKRKGKIWHNLSYGLYPDRQSANNAIKSLPTDLVQIKPWIRKLENIQEEVRNLDK